MGALELRKNSNENIKIAETLKNIGDVYKHEERFDLAIEAYDGCLKIRRSHLGNNCEEAVADVLIARGMAVKGTNKEEAKESYQEALTIRKQLFDKSDDRV